jgi:hypothetical protein
VTERTASLAAKKSLRERQRRSGQNAPVARPRLLTTALADRLVFAVEMGSTLGGAARAAGCSPRSLRRWQQRGRAALEALPVEAWLVLSLDRAQERNPSALLGADGRHLQALAPERWDTPTLDELFAADELAELRRSEPPRLLEA